MKPIRLMAGFFTVGLWTLLSRVLGFVRDLALNARFGGGGSGPLMDCWATAQMLPNLFRRLFAEGAFAQGFVPVFAAARATDPTNKQMRPSSRVTISHRPMTSLWREFTGPRLHRSSRTQIDVGNGGNELVAKVFVAFNSR